MCPAVLSSTASTTCRQSSECTEEGTEMNRLILKYAYPITFIILAILAWVVYRIFSAGGSGLIGFVIVTVIVGGPGRVVFIYLWPTVGSRASKRAIGRQWPDSPLPVKHLDRVP